MGGPGETGNREQGRGEEMTWRLKIGSWRFRIEIPGPQGCSTVSQFVLLNLKPATFNFQFLTFFAISPGGGGVGS
jgi:hypothetical protein